MLTITKTFEFAYGHHLPDYDGKCASPHGHNGILEVEVKRPAEHIVLDAGSVVEPQTGMIMDFGYLKGVVKEKVLDQMDHKYLNSDLPEIGRPTAENMTLWIVKVLGEYFGDALVRVRCYETSTSYAEWRA
jgi:6-pyruvoyltetrahydropterin/6-carboxytetrahydropterin synthase